MQVIAAHVHADTRAAVSQECARELVEQHADMSVAPWEGDAWRLQEMVAAVRCVTARPQLTNTHTFRLRVGLGVFYRQCRWSQLALGWRRCQMPRVFARVSPRVLFWTPSVRRAARAQGNDAAVSNDSVDLVLTWKSLLSTRSCM